MQIWQDLVKQAIIGSQRNVGKLPLSPAALQERQQHWQTLSDEQHLLNALALVETYRAVGQTATISSDAPATAAEAETQTYIPTAIQQRLQRYLHEQNHSLIKEVLALLGANHFVLTPDILAEFLAWCEKNRADAVQVRTVIGKRGLWLCALNPAWEALLGLAAPQQDTAVWQAAHGPARLSLFAQALASDLSATLAQLHSQWPSENAKDRQALLEVLANQLTAEMLPFLQGLQEDRSQGVREKATQMLAKLQDPALIGLLDATLSPILTVTKPLLGKAQLHVQLPDSLSETWKKRGLQEKLDYLPTSHDKIGAKSGWLYQWLGLSDPLHLAQNLGLSSEKLLVAAAHSEFAAVVLNGLDAGAMLHGCTDFLAPRFAILKFKGQAAWLQKMAQAFSLAALEPFIINHLKQLKGRDTWAFIMMFTTPQATLSSGLASTIIDTLLAVDTATLYAYDRKTLAQLAFKLPLADFASLSRRLQAHDNDQFHELLENFSQRQALHQEFAHD